MWKGQKTPPRERPCTIKHRDHSSGAYPHLSLSPDFARTFETKIASLCSVSAERQNPPQGGAACPSGPATRTCFGVGLRREGPQNHITLRPTPWWHLAARKGREVVQDVSRLRQPVDLNNGFLHANVVPCLPTPNTSSAELVSGPRHLICAQKRMEPRRECAFGVRLQRRNRHECARQGYQRTESDCGTMIGYLQNWN